MLCHRSICTGSRRNLFRKNGTHTCDCQIALDTISWCVLSSGVIWACLAHDNNHILIVLLLFLTIPGVLHTASHSNMCILYVFLICAVGSRGWSHLSLSPIMRVAITAPSFPRFYSQKKCWHTHAKVATWTRNQLILLFYSALPTIWIQWQGARNSIAKSPKKTRTRKRLTPAYDCERNTFYIARFDNNSSHLWLTDTLWKRSQDVASGGLYGVRANVWQHVSRGGRVKVGASLYSYTQSISNSVHSCIRETKFIVQ